MNLMALTAVKQTTTIYWINLLNHWVRKKGKPQTNTLLSKLQLNPKTYNKNCEDAEVVMIFPPLSVSVENDDLHRKVNTWQIKTWKKQGLGEPITRHLNQCQADHFSHLASLTSACVLHCCAALSGAIRHHSLHLGWSSHKPPPPAHFLPIGIYVPNYFCPSAIPWTYPVH